jgi:cytoskeleton protein RodZ
MSDVTGSEAAPPVTTLTAGAMLRAAREAHGWSIDTVGQQLKLAPRQVLALEDDRPDDLPGRTFVRGFARNYARLVGLDPEAVVAALPDLGEAGASEGAPLSASSRSIGEMPVATAPQGSSFARWAIPLLLVALIAAAAFYEFGGTGMWPGGSGSGEPATPVGRKPAEAPAGASGIALPNPLTSADPAPAPAPIPEAAPGAAPPVSPPGAPIGPSSGAGSPGLAPASSVSGPQSMSGAITTGAAPAAALSTAAAPTTPGPATAPSPGGEPTLVIEYRQSAWTEVRDARGQRVLLHTGAPGSRQSVQGTPPLDLTLGNATEVSITWRGAPVDLAPHVAKNNIARVRLQ